MIVIGHVLTMTVKVLIVQFCTYILQCIELQNSSTVIL